MLTSRFLDAYAMFPKLQHIIRNSLQELQNVSFLLSKGFIKGYKVLDLTTKQVFLPRDVIFYEHIFPLLEHTGCNQTEHSDYCSTSLKTAFYSDVLPHSIPIGSFPIAVINDNLDEVLDHQSSADIPIP